MLRALRSQGIENIVIYVCDSLRWDYAPPEVMDAGLTVLTVASSLYTAPSFPSIVCGLYPPKHGVDNFQDVVAEGASGLLSLPGYHASLWCETTWTQWPRGESALHTILRNPPAIPIDDIGVPFVYLEDDKGGHCPYGLPFDASRQPGCHDFYREYGEKGIRELQSLYDRGIRQSVARFKRRLRVLRDRALVEKTLVIFTSDHGELLGEYGGLTGHGLPCCAELVYVPTVFIHPSIRGGPLADDGVIRHVDLFPTVAALLRRQLPHDVDGVNLLDQENVPRIGLNFTRGGYFRARNQRRFTYAAESVWDHRGGHVFHRQPLPMSLPYFIYKRLLRTDSDSIFMKQALRGRALGKTLSAYYTALRHLASRYVRYGQPQIDRQAAAQILREYLEDVGDGGRPERLVQNDKDVEDRLRGLGYVD